MVFSFWWEPKEVQVKCLSHQQPKLQSFTICSLHHLSGTCSSLGHYSKRRAPGKMCVLFSLFQPPGDTLLFTFLFLNWPGLTVRSSPVARESGSIELWMPIPGEHTVSVYFQLLRGIFRMRWGKNNISKLSFLWSKNG